MWLYRTSAVFWTASRAIFVAQTVTVTIAASPTVNHPERMYLQQLAEESQVQSSISTERRTRNLE
jgi:hypothetical protein